MEQTEFEKRIAAKAQKKFDDQVVDLARVINSHPIGKCLKIKFDGSEVPLANFGQNYGILNGLGLENKNAERTNLRSVEEDLLREYRQQEVDDIMSKLENFNYLFNQ